MEELLQDCAPEGTATPAFNARIHRLARGARLRRWLSQLLLGVRGGRRKLPVPPKPSADEDDAAWMDLQFLHHDAARRTPRTVRKLERDRVAASRQRKSRH